MANSKFVLGRDALRRTLAKLPKAVKSRLQDSMTTSGNEMADLMRARVPKGKTGALHDSIRVEPRKDADVIGVLVKAGGPTTTKPVRQGQSATYDYAMGVELGTADMLQQPFFFPSYRAKKTATKRRASRAVRKAVEDVTK